MKERKESASANINSCEVFKIEYYAKILLDVNSCENSLPRCES